MPDTETKAPKIAASDFPVLQQIPLEALEPSPSNPRHAMSHEGLKELTANVRQKGILEPLLVRPKTVKNGESVLFQIVAGHRRYRAARLAGLTTVPCVVREMADAEALEASIIENLQREGVSEIDEAEGYRQLMQGFEETRGQTADEIATKVGKSREYVYARLKLLDLGDTARQALGEGAITAGHAVIIARMTPADQVRAVKYCRREGYDGERPSVRELQEKKTEFERSLKGVPWKLSDAKLLPEAGNCTDCAKREGTTCHDPQCFAKKQAATLEALKARHPDAHLLSFGSYENYVVGALNQKRWREAGGKNGKCEHSKPGIVVEIQKYSHASGRQIGQVLGAVCAEPSCKVHFPSAGGSTASRSRVDWEKREAKHKERQKRDEAVDRALLAEMRTKITEAGRKELRLAVRSAFLNDCYDHERLKSLGLPRLNPRRIDRMNLHDLARGLVLLALVSSSVSRRELRTAVASYHVNIKAVEKRVLAELKAKAPSAKGAAVAKAQKRKAASRGKGARKK